MACYLSCPTFSLAGWRISQASNSFPEFRSLPEWPIYPLLPICWPLSSLLKQSEGVLVRWGRKGRDISSPSVQKDYSNAETLSRYHKERGNNQDQTCFYYCRVKSPSPLLSLKTFQTPPIPGASEHRVAALGSKCHDGVGLPATWFFEASSLCKVSRQSFRLISRDGYGTSPMSYHIWLD